MPAMDAKWYRLARYDSAIVSMPDGTVRRVLPRDREQFRDWLKRTVAIHRAARREWRELAERVPRGSCREMTSPEAWEETFDPGWTASRRWRVTPDGRGTTSDAPLQPPAGDQGLLEVFRRRYLLRLLVRREISARYQGSFLGLLWSYINPLSQFFIYCFVMRMIIGLPRVENFAIHVFSALVVVHFFTETFNAGTRSIVRNKALVSKMAMPREMFPVASMLVSLFHIGPQLVILVACLLLGWAPDPVGMPAFVLALVIIMVLGTALALLFSVANVFFRDFGNVGRDPDELRPLRRADDLPLHAGRRAVRRARAASTSLNPSPTPCC